MSGQVIWPLASDNQKHALANVPKLTSFLSILGSCYIIVDILRLKKRNTYHRIILGMNIMDLMSLIAWFFTTWPIPRDTPGVMGAIGNQQTCDAQGFFSQLSIATVLYNVCLAIYFMLVIRHGWTEKRIAETKLEYYFHTLCIGVGIGTAVAALVLELYNPAGWQCWIAVAPTGCDESWKWSNQHQQRNETTTRIRWLQEDFENSFFVNTTPPSSAVDQTIADHPLNYPCERGYGANLYVWFLFYFPLWISIVVATCCLYQVYAAYHRQDQIVEKWRQKLLMTATGASGKVIHVATGATKRISGAATTTTHKLTDVAKRPFVTPVSSASSRRRGSNNKRKRTPTTTPIYTPAQKKKILQKQRSRSPTSFGLEQHPQMRDTSDSYHSSRMRDYSRQSSVSSLGASSSRRGRRDKTLPPVLGSKAYAGRTHHPCIDHLNDQLNESNQQCQHPHHLPKILRRTKTDDATAGTVATSNTRRTQQNAKSKLVTSQALLYLCSFYVAWAFPSILRIQESTTAEGVAYWHWMFLSAIFCPLQGLMNFIVYIRPKYLAIRREKRRIAAIAKQQQELEKLHGENSYYRNYYKSTKWGGGGGAGGGSGGGDGDKSTVPTFMQGSSSALLTIQSEDAVADSQQLSQANNSSHHSSSDPLRTNSNHHHATTIVEGVPSSSSSSASESDDDEDDDNDDDDSSHQGQHDDVEVMAVWTSADLAAMEAVDQRRYAYEHQQSSLHEEAVTDLFDALDGTNNNNNADKSLQFSIPPATPTHERPQFFRSNSSNSNFFSMRPLDGEIMTNEEVLNKFHTSVSYDSRGHVSVARLGRRSPKQNNNQTTSPLHSIEKTFQSSWPKGWGKAISSFIKRTSSGLSSHSNDNDNDNKGYTNQRDENDVVNDNSIDEDFNDHGSSLSFATGVESLGTSHPGGKRSSGSQTSGSAAFGLDPHDSSGGSTSFQSAQSSSASFSIQSSSAGTSVPPSLPISSLHSSQSGNGQNRRISFQGTHLMATSIVEVDSEEEDVLSHQSPTPPPAPSPPARTSNPHPIDTGVRNQFKNFRRNRKQQEVEQQMQQQSVSDRGGEDDDFIRQPRISMDMLPSFEEKSRRMPKPIRRTETDPRKKTGGGTRRVSPTRGGLRRPNDTHPAPAKVKGVSWQRSPDVHFNLDNDSHAGDFASSAGDVASSDGGAMFSVGSGSVSSKRKWSRRELMKKTQSGWKSSRKGGKLLTDGAKSGFRSIRNFAVTFKDALAADAYDDWATALDESDIMARGAAVDTTATTGKNHERRSNHPLEEVNEDWRESKVKVCDTHEEQKEEIDAFEHHHHSDAFEQEHSETTHDMDVFERKGSKRSLA